MRIKQLGLIFLIGLSLLMCTIAEAVVARRVATPVGPGGVGPDRVYRVAPRPEIVEQPAVVPGTVADPLVAPGEVVRRPIRR